MLETLLIARAVLYGRPVRLHAPRNPRADAGAQTARSTKRGAFLTAARKMSQLIARASR